MRTFAIVLLFAALAGGASGSLAQTSPAHADVKPTVTTIEVPPAPKPLLPSVFDGWVQSAPPQLSSDPAQIESSDAAALGEYGFAYGENASYKRDGNETLTLRAMRFHDLSGAYGAYSCLRPNGWAGEDIGDGAASDKNRVIFWKGETVIEANYSTIGPMTAGELRSLAAHIPAAAGNRAVPPEILAFLPAANLVHRTTHYAEGPAGYAAGGGVLPASVVDFGKDAETATANYSLPSGPATLTLIEYPTPQVAMEREKAIRAYIQDGVSHGGKGVQPPWTQALASSDAASLEVRRSGVLVALVSGDAIPDESHRLVELVHYEANLVKMPQSTLSEVQKTGKLLLSITVIVIAIAVFTILLGLFLGGGRALWRMAHGKPASTVYDEEFIHLDLSERWNGARNTAEEETHRKA